VSEAAGYRRPWGRQRDRLARVFPRTQAPQCAACSSAVRGRGVGVGARHRATRSIFRRTRLDHALVRDRLHHRLPFLVGHRLVLRNHARRAERESDIAPDESIARATGRKLDLEKYGKIWPYSVASLYAQNGQADAMFMWLDRAGQRAAPNLLIDPFALRYKDDPRFTALCNKLGLPVPGTPLPASPTLSSSAGAP
ncbi:MAG TPA: hypothetical protein VFK31_09350, partial [Rhodanobacteraceae bacterium]|nr:hypothetical protein [Rhodanobacteraceae bacterium]